MVFQATELKLVNKIGRESVRLILKRHGMKPCRKKMWFIPKIEEQCRERMGDVLNLYEKPYNAKEPLICIDDKPAQLLKAYRKSEKCPDGSVRDDYEYKRQNTASIFCCVEAKEDTSFKQRRTDAA